MISIEYKNKYLNPQIKEEAMCPYGHRPCPSPQNSSRNPNPKYSTKCINKILKIKHETKVLLVLHQILYQSFVQYVNEVVVF